MYGFAALSCAVLSVGPGRYEASPPSESLPKQRGAYGLGSYKRRPFPASVAHGPDRAACHARLGV